MENMKIFEMADRLKILQERKKDLEAQTKALTAEIAELDEQLSDAMTEAELVCFIRNHQIRIIGQQFFFKPPCRFVIYNHHLQAIIRKLRQLLLFLSHRAL